MNKKTSGEPREYIPPSVSPHFFIGTIAHSDVDVSTCLCIQTLRLTGHDFNWIIMDYGGNSRTRNILMTQFLRQEWGNSAYMIFIDRDIAFNPEHVDMILEDLQNGYQFVGGLYGVRDSRHFAQWNKSGFDIDGTVKPIDWVATGFSGVTRKLLQKMVKELDLPLLHKGEPVEFYPFGEQQRYKTPEGNDMWLSEDYDFCNKVRKVKEKSYLDTRVTVGHIGTKLITCKDVMANLQKEKEENNIPTLKLAKE
jgi:hypothetical protein